MKRLADPTTHFCDGNNTVGTRTTWSIRYDHTAMADSDPGKFLLLWLHPFVASVMSPDHLYIFPIVIVKLCALTVFTCRVYNEKSALVVCTDVIVTDNGTWWWCLDLEKSVTISRFDFLTSNCKALREWINPKPGYNVDCYVPKRSMPIARYLFLLRP